jgi:hypothetical protein
MSTNYDAHSQEPIDWYELATLITGLTARQWAEAALTAMGKWK